MRRECLRLQGEALPILLTTVWLIGIPIKNAIYEVSTALLVMLFLFHMIRRHGRRVLGSLLRELGDVLVPMSLILASMAVANLGAMLRGAYLSFDPWWTVLEFFYRYVLVLVAIVFWVRDGRLSLGWIVLGVVLSGWVQIIGGVIDLLQQQGVLHGVIRSNFSPRLIGLAREPNALGFFTGLLVLVYGLLLLRLREDDRCRRAVPWLVASLFGCLVLLAASYSRSAWVGLAVSLVFLLGLKVFGGRLSPGRALVLMGGVATIIALAYMGSDRFQSIFDTAANSDRLGIWSGVLSLIEAHPITGHGMGVDVARTHMQELTGFYAAHNAELEILFHTGVVGLLAWAWWFFALFRRVRRVDEDLLVFPVFFFVAVQFVHSPFYSVQMLSALTVFLAFVLALTTGQGRRARAVT